MTEEEFKRQLRIRLFDTEVSSPRIGDRYMGVKQINVTLEFTFRSAVLQIPYTIKINRILKSSDKLFLNCECVNPHCTSLGFDITRYLNEALQSRKFVTGLAHCSGKEDWKYIKTSGCSCLTTLNYIIDPEFEDE